MASEIPVRLDRGECIVAALVGAWRNVRALFDPYRRPTPGSEAEEWGWDVEGAGAEIAVAKTVNRYWNGMRRLDRAEGDVNGWEIRSAPEQSPGGSETRLIVRQGDPDDRVLVFVTGRMPNYVIRGWIKAADARKTEWWEAPREPGGWFVPRAALRPLEEAPGAGV